MKKLMYIIISIAVVLTVVSVGVTAIPALKTAAFSNKKPEFTASIDNLKQIDFLGKGFETRVIEDKEIYIINIRVDSYTDLYFYPTRELYEKIQQNPDKIQLYLLDGTITNPNKKSLLIDRDICPKQEGEFLFDSDESSYMESRVVDAESALDCRYYILGYEKTQEEAAACIKNADIGKGCFLGEESFDIKLSIEKA